MEEYVSLDKKYRPKVLEQLVGQDEIVYQIKGMFAKNRLSRTFLLIGPKGSGKTSTARLIAKYANCHNFDKENIKPCGKCPSCKTFTPNGIEGNRNIHEHNAANARSIDDIRAIITQSQFIPSDNYRIYIIDECHMLTPQAQECFLKPLEEPSKRTIFILCTTNPEKIIGTILSRCKKLTVRPLKSKTTVGLLGKICKKENVDVNKKVLRKIAVLTDNHPRDSLQALETLIDMMEGGKKITGDETIHKAIEQVTGIPPWQIVSGFLFSIYRGSLVGAYKKVEYLENGDYFMKEVMKYHTNASYLIMTDGNDEDLIDRTFYKFNSSVKEMIKNEVIVPTNEFKLLMAEAMVDFVQTASQIKEYLVDFKYLLIACVSRLAPKFKEARIKAESKSK